MEKDNVKFKIEFKGRLYRWVVGLVHYIGDLPKDNVTQVLAQQLLRSGTSVCANYIEAQAGASKKDFANFLHHALKSGNESKFWLALLRDTRKADPRRTAALLAELTELCNILAASLLTIKGRRQP